MSVGYQITDMRDIVHRNALLTSIPGRLGNLHLSQSIIAAKASSSLIINLKSREFDSYHPDIHFRTLLRMISKETVLYTGAEWPF